MRRMMTMKRIALVAFMSLAFTKRIALVAFMSLAFTLSAQEVVWKKTFGGSDDDKAYSIVATADGGFAVAGWTRSYGAGSKDLRVIRLLDGSVRQVAQVGRSKSSVGNLSSNLPQGSSVEEVEVAQVGRSKSSAGNLSNLSSNLPRVVLWGGAYYAA